MNSQSKATLRTISTVLVIVIVVLAFLIAGIRIFGFQIYGVTSDSMAPEYPKGALVYVQKTDVQDLRVRDVITYQLDKKNISTHRINEIVRDETTPNALKFRTKGDANDEPDAKLVTEADIIGRVAFSIPHLGNLASYIQQPPGIYVAIVIGIALVVLVVMTDKISADDAKVQSEKKKQGVLTKLGLNKKTAAKNASPMKQGYVPGQSARPAQQQTMQPNVAQPQQYPQGYAQQQQYPQGYVQPQQYPRQGYTPQQQYPQGYAQQYPQGYAQQQYPQQGYAPQQYPQGYVQQYPQQQYPQGYAQQQYPQGYAQAQQGTKQ